MLDIGLLVFTGIYLLVVCARDKKYRKEMKRIAKQTRHKTKIQYVPVDRYNVINLSDYRRKYSRGNAG